MCEGPKSPGGDWVKLFFDFPPGAGIGARKRNVKQNRIKNEDYENSFP